MYFGFTDLRNTEMVRPNDTTGNLRMAAVCRLPDGLKGNSAIVPSHDGMTLKMERAGFAASSTRVMLPSSLRRAAGANRLAFGSRARIGVTCRKAYGKQAGDEQGIANIGKADPSSIGLALFFGQFVQADRGIRRRRSGHQNNL
jgi:hypothetical protein